MATKRARDAVRAAVPLVLSLAALAACGTAPPPTTVAPPDPPTSTPGRSPSPAPAVSGAPEPSGTFSVPATGFAFDAASVLGYYESVGYACEDPVPDATVPGHVARTCRLVDANGRTRTIRLIADGDGRLVRGSAGMTGAAGEGMVDAVVALEPLAGFLGAMLGEARGSELLPWLAGHLGDRRAETGAGGLDVLTYIEDGAGEATLVVEIVDPDFARPSAVPD